MMKSTKRKMEQTELAKKKNWRLIQDNEIVIEFDDCPDSTSAIMEIGNNLLSNGFSFEIWKAEGQRSPHIHIKNFNKKLTKEYKKNFIQKYVPQQWVNYADFSLCSKHMIAQEDKPHYKYRTIKKLLGKWNENKENLVENDLYESEEEDKIDYTKTTGITAEIVKKVSIINLAKSYGLNVVRSRSECPFHNGDNPTSLEFSRQKGTFRCYSCGIHGNIVDFVKECKRRGMKKNG